MPRNSSVMLAPAGWIGQVYAASPYDLTPPPARMHGVIWETFLASYDRPPAGTREASDGWVPGALVRGVDEAGVERAWVNFRCAVVLWVTGDGDIDELAGRFADRFGMVWRIPTSTPPTYVVVLPATEPLFAEYDALAAALVDRLGDAWQTIEPESPVIPLPFAAPDHPNLVRHLHGEFVEAAHRTKFRSPLDPAPARKRPIDLPEPLPELVETHDLAGAAKKLGQLLRATIVLELGAEGEVGPEDSRTRVGGCPSLPADLAWPEYAGEPMHFVAQIDLAKVHAVDSDTLLPATGMLWLFVNRDWTSSSATSKRKRDGLIQVLHRPEVTGLEPRTSPAPNDPRDGYPATLRKVLSLPAPYSPHLAVDRLAGDYHGFFDEFVRVVQGGPEPTRLLGHVGVSDHGKLSKKADVQLFQTRGEWIGADGFDLVHFLIAEDDLRAGAWDRVRFETVLG